MSINLNRIKLAGKHWAQCFLRRNREQSVRNLETGTVSRILDFNELQIAWFYVKLLALLGCTSWNLILSSLSIKVDFHVCKPLLQLVGYNGQTRFGLPQVLGEHASLDRAGLLAVSDSKLSSHIFSPAFETPHDAHRSVNARGRRIPVTQQGINSPTIKV
jgi:hypothetical protein